MSVIEDAKATYKKEAGELYMVNLNNPMERQARGEYQEKESVTFEHEETQDVETSDFILEDDGDVAIDFSPET